MNNKIYGIYGCGSPGKQGESGEHGYDISANVLDTKDGSVLEINLVHDSSVIEMGDYVDDTKKYYISALSTNVYYKDTTNNEKYYQFNYSLNTADTDLLKIVAYLLFDNNTVYDPSAEDTSKFIVLKDFYEPINEVDSSILYTDSHKLTKMIVYAFKKTKGYIYEKIYLGEKEF